jgi:hypothetical protein
MGGVGRAASPPIGVSVHTPVLVTIFPSGPTDAVSHSCTTHLPVALVISLALLKPVEVQVVVVGAAVLAGAFEKGGKVSSRLKGLG